MVAMAAMVEMRLGMGTAEKEVVEGQRAGTDPVAMAAMAETPQETEMEVTEVLEVADLLVAMAAMAETLAETGMEVTEVLEARGDFLVAMEGTVVTAPMAVAVRADLAV